MITTSIICPVWNKAGLTQRFLYYHWLLYRERDQWQMIMVNNGSFDHTASLLDQWQSRLGDRLAVVSLPENKGFSGGNNAGLAVAKGENVIFISNDVTPLGDYIGLVEAALVDNPEALVGAELLSHDTGWNTFNGQTLPYLAGWCVAGRRATWDRLGGWDERYFPCDYEDLDLSQTARCQGVPLKQVILPLAHDFGPSAAQIAGGREAATRRNQQLFREKWGLDEKLPAP